MYDYSKSRKAREEHHADFDARHPRRPTTIEQDRQAAREAAKAKQAAAARLSLSTADIEILRQLSASLPLISSATSRRSAVIENAIRRNQALNPEGRLHPADGTPAQRARNAERDLWLVKVGA